MPKAKSSSLFLLFLLFPFVIFFFLPPTPPHTPSHTISIKGKLSRSWQELVISVCVRVYACVYVWGIDSQREGQRGACRETQERDDWQGSNTNRYWTHTLSHRGRTLNSALSPSHSRAHRTGCELVCVCLCACIRFPFFSKRWGSAPLSDVTRPTERRVRVCDPQMPGNHCGADRVASRLRPSLLCSNANYASW